MTLWGNRISLCMIVKDEAARLAGSLASAVGQVDEMVVADTGSRDQTPGIAASWGARVISCPWTGDFSAARNHALNECTGDWILWLDADERLVVPNRAADLHALTAAAGVGAYLVPIRNLKLEAGFELHQAVRLFRKSPGIHFEGRVHEGVDASLQRLSVPIGNAAFFIEHLGYAVSPQQLEAKLRRNLALLEEQDRCRPNQCFTLYYLALTRIALKDRDAGLRCLLRARQLSAPTANVRALILNLLAYCYLGREEFSLCERHALESLAEVEEQNTARLLYGVALYNQHRCREALPWLHHAYQFQRLPIDRRRTRISQEHSCAEADLLQALARCYEAIGDLVSAYAFLGLYLKQRCADAGAWVRHARLALALGNPAEAEQDFQRALSLGSSEAKISQSAMNTDTIRGPGGDASSAFASPPFPPPRSAEADGRVRGRRP